MSKRNKAAYSQAEEKRAKRIFRNIIIVLLAMGILLIVGFSFM